MQHRDNHMQLIRVILYLLHGVASYPGHRKQKLGWAAVGLMPAGYGVNYA
uniref:Uncharacterized protein n=1 Tax=Rhodnius prolixus TaxID=13249 RepID=T1I752_RHOPR